MNVFWVHIGRNLRKGGVWSVTGSLAGELCSLQNPYVEVFTSSTLPGTSVFGETVFKQIILLKWNHVIGLIYLSHHLLLPRHISRKPNWKQRQNSDPGTQMWGVAPQAVAYVLHCNPHSKTTYNDCEQLTFRSWWYLYFTTWQKHFFVWLQPLQ